MPHQQQVFQQQQMFQPQQMFQQQIPPHQQQMIPGMMHPAQYAQMYQQQMMRMGMMNQNNGWGQQTWQSSANYLPAAAPNRGKKRKGNKKKVASKQPKTEETVLPDSADKSKEPEPVAVET